MNVYEVLKKYYTYQQLCEIPKMFKKIDVIGQAYINIYDTNINDERRCFQIIAKHINDPCKTFNLPSTVIVSETDPIEKVAEDMFKIINLINQKAKTLKVTGQVAKTDPVLRLFHVFCPVFAGGKTGIALEYPGEVALG